ncbi:hypothetical protein BaRGS_00030645, partial [Batillaria attramentaria]
MCQMAFCLYPTICNFLVDKVRQLNDRRRKKTQPNVFPISSCRLRALCVTREVKEDNDCSRVYLAYCVIPILRAIDP